MVAFYIMIVRARNMLQKHTLTSVVYSQAICAWFYGGQPELEAMLNCPGTVAESLLGEGSGTEAAAEGAHEVLKTLARALV